MEKRNYKSIEIRNIKRHQEEEEIQEEMEEIEEEMEEIEEEMEEESKSTISSLDKDDPIDGPCAQFLESLLKSGSIAIHATNLVLTLEVVDVNGKPQQAELANVTLSNDERLTLLQSSINSLLSLLKTGNVDFEAVSSETQEDQLDEDTTYYVDLSNIIVNGAKSLAQEPQLRDRVAEIMVDVLEWAVKHNQQQVYSDLFRLGKLNKLIAWELARRNV